MTWTLRRLALSTFILAHLAAVTLWNLPPSAIRERLAGWTPYYILPTGQNQAWDMFAPDPIQSTLALKAVVRDRFGMFHNFEFPRLDGLSPWQALLGFRHAKYPAELVGERSAVQREFAARYVLRRIDLPPDSYPADVELYCDMRPVSPPGLPPDDPMTPPQHYTLQVYRFPSFEEAQP